MCHLLSLSGNTTASNNTAVGRSALQSNTTGTANTAIGKDALLANTTANNNTAVGMDALTANTTGSENTAVGQNALLANTTASDNVGIGHSALEANTTGAANTALGKNSGKANTTGSSNVYLGRDTGITGSPGGNNTGGNGAIFLGDENIGDAHIQVDWTVASDARDKTDVEPIKTGLDFVNKLEPVTYRWDKRSKYGDKYADDYDLNAQTPDGTHKEDWLDVGFLAQDVEELEAEYSYNMQDNTNLATRLSDDGKQYSLKYTKFIPSLVKAVQELSAQVEELKTQPKCKCNEE